MPLSSLCSSIDEIQTENNQIKNAIGENIFEIDEGRPFPVQGKFSKMLNLNKK